MVMPVTDLIERYAAIGDAIRRDRDATESQAKFCDRIGVSTTKLRELEKGKPGNYRAGTLIRISGGIWGRRDVLDRILGGESLDDILADDGAADPSAHDAGPVAGAAAAAEALLDVLDRARRSATALAPFDDDPAFDGPRAQLREVLAVARDSVPALVGIVRDAADHLETLDGLGPAAVSPRTLAHAASLASSATAIVSAFGLRPELPLAADGDQGAARRSLDPEQRRRRPAPPAAGD